MRRTLIDTGPIVALLNRRDRFHRWAVETLSAVNPPVLTCEAVLAESAHLLRAIPGGPEKVLELVGRGVVQPSFRLDAEVAAVRALMGRYRSVQMDLADACLVRMTEQLDSVLLTLDSEFRDVFRRHGRSAIPVLMPNREARG